MHSWLAGYLSNWKSLPKRPFWTVKPRVKRQKRMTKVGATDYRSATEMLRLHQNPQRAVTARRFFKDTTGEVFLGVSTPMLRRIARQFSGLSLADSLCLLKSRLHEERLLAIEVLRFQYHKGNSADQQRIFDFYVRHRRYISSWDCVDGSAPYIVGCHLLKRDKKLIYELAASPRIWDRRIAIVSSLRFIRRGNIRDTLKLAKILLHDKEDLIHKATGWMLREVGKQDLAALKKFLDAHAAVMPRTMLRYAIERFTEAERTQYLAS